MKNQKTFFWGRDCRIVSIRMVVALSLIILGAFLVPAMGADKVTDAEINESVSVFIPAEDTSRVLVKGTSVRVLETQGENAVINVGLKNGLSVDTQIPVKYLNITPSKQDTNIVIGVAGPNAVTASPIEAPPPEITIAAKTGRTFSIENIRVHDTSGVERGVEVDIKIAKDAESKKLITKAYYFDRTGQLVQTIAQPLEPSLPTLLPKDSTSTIRFPLLKNLPIDWNLVVVFGNSRGAVAESVPGGHEQNLAYPERDLVAKTLLSPDVAVDSVAPTSQVIEQLVQSGNPRYPAFTLLMHLPHGVKNPKDVSGVMAVCLLSNSVADIRNRLLAIKPVGEPDPYFAYAEAHHMAVIAWGARWVWNSYANFDELNKDQNRLWDQDFESLADAWDHGIQLLVFKYGIPDHDYLMYGLCAGGEWAHRLALHKPDRFLAVQMHISTSYDTPTPEGNHVMWLLTTGELDFGYDRARRFYSAARSLGYPIIFKAFMGLGHGDSSMADQLGIRFFDYALALKAKREAAKAGSLVSAPPMDLSGFDTSPFYGDLMNQDMFVATDKEMVPHGFLVPLPTKDIADAWNK
jgi:hypothetical protein